MSYVDSNMKFHCHWFDFFIFQKRNFTTTFHSLTVFWISRKIFNFVSHLLPPLRCVSSCAYSNMFSKRNSTDTMYNGTVFLMYAVERELSLMLFARRLGHSIYTWENERLNCCDWWENSMEILLVRSVAGVWSFVYSKCIRSSKSLTTLLTNVMFFTTMCCRMKF